MNILLRTDNVPVVPDAPTARRWATEELANPAYHHGQSLLGRFLGWLGSLFDGLTVPSGMPNLAVAGLLVLAFIAIAGVAFWIAGPVRLSRRAAKSAIVFGDDTRSAAELRAAADASAAAGDWPAAVLDRFRAIVRALEERTLLEEWPGRTAHEAAESAAVRLPSRTADLRRAGGIFDLVCYGKTPADAATDAWLRELDTALAATRPTPVLVGAP